MFRDGWICRACWKPNRAQDDRCYKCKTPRDEQLEVEAGSLRAKVAPGGHLEGRLDAEIPVLALLAAWPLRIYGAASIGLGILVFLLALLSGESDEAVLGIPAQLFVAGLGLVLVGWGLVQYFLAAGVRRHARWAYALALVFGVIGALPRLLNLEAAQRIPEGIGRTIWLVAPWLYLAMTLCAAVLLVASFVRRQPEPEAVS